MQCLLGESDPSCYSGKHHDRRRRANLADIPDIGPKGAALSHTCSEGEYLPAELSLLYEIRPLLHHSGARFQVQSMIVGRAHCVTRRVGKLEFHVIV
jgi:hypothetical protein